jgi:hypothetical protein
MRPVWGLFWGLVVWLVACACAHAEGDVVLFERAPLRPGLCAALRIQLSGSARVRCLADGPGEALAERLSTTRERLRKEQGALGVLLERDADARLMRMYLVTGVGEQATLAIERIEDRPEPDVDRSLALKVRDAFEVIAFVDSALPAHQASAAAVLAGPRAGPEPGVPSPAQGLLAGEAAGPFWLSFVELGGGLSLGGGTQGLGYALLGVGRAVPRFRYELGLGARLASRQHESTRLGSLGVVERGALLTARFLWRSGRFELGAALNLSVLFASAEAVFAEDTQRRTLVTPTLGVGPALRVRVFHFVYLQCAPSLELKLIRQRFALDDQQLIDRQQLGFVFPLSLLISLPLEKTPEGFQP